MPAIFLTAAVPWKVTRWVRNERAFFSCAVFTSYALYYSTLCWPCSAHTYSRSMGFDYSTSLSELTARCLHYLQVVLEASARLGLTGFVRTWETFICHVSSSVSKVFRSIHQELIATQSQELEVGGEGTDKVILSDVLQMNCSLSYIIYLLVIIYIERSFYQATLRTFYMEVTPY